jgi:transposase
MKTDNRRMEGMTVSEIAKELKISVDAVRKRIETARIKPLSREAVYDKDAVKILKAVKMGRPKYIKLFMRNPTKEKVKWFLNSAKKTLKSFISAKNKFDIWYSLSSSMKSPNKHVESENNEYAEISNIVWELFEKQGKNELFNEEVLKSLENVGNICGDEELLQLIKEIETSREPAAETSKKPRKT